jgi:hypothetical protein
MTFSPEAKPPPSPGSIVFVVFALICISLFVLLLLRYYLPLRTTPAYLTFPVFLALALPATLIILVPIDLASNPLREDVKTPHGIWLPERALLVLWRIIYWLTFALTWFILPLLGEYVDSGDREPWDKMMYSLRSNGKFHLMVLGAGGLGAVYFFLAEGFNPTSLRALVMALAYAWGLILAIYLMGHGLVALPRKIFKDADAGRRLRKLQSQAPTVKEKLVEASDELLKYEEQVQLLRARKSGTALDFQEWIQDLGDMTNLPESRVLNGLGTTRQTVPQVITGRYLAELTRKLQRAVHRKLRYSSEWNNLLNDAARAQAIIDAKRSGSLTFPSGGNIKSLSPQMRYRLYAHIYPAVSYTAAILLALASICILWSELTKTFVPRWSLISLSVAGTSTAKHIMDFFPSQLFASFWITYMSICALYSVTVLPIWGNRALVRRTTYSESAAWYAAQVAKLTVPLAYNFLTFLPKDVHHETMFYAFLGKYVDLTPLGRGFSSFFPLLLLFPVMAALFGWYGTIKGVLGMGDLLAPDELEDQWREGKDIIDRELRSLGGTAQSQGLGLVDSREGSLDLENRPTNLGRQTDLSRQAAANYLANNPASSSSRTIGAARTPAPAGARPARFMDSDEEDADENTGFFSEFAHRVKNTIDGTDKPSWLKRPQWMSGDGADGESGFQWNTLFGGNGRGSGVRL